MRSSVSPTQHAALVGNRRERWRFDLLTLTDAPAGTLDGVSGGTVDYSVHDTIRSGGNLSTYNLDVDWNTVRVQPWYIIEDAAGQEIISWPLGVFIPAAPTTAYDDLGNTEVTVELYDKMLVLDQDAVETTYTVDVGRNVVEAVREVIRSAGETRIALTDSSETVQTAMVWEAGTTKLRIVNDLLDSINYFSIWVDGEGVYRADPYTPPSRRGVAWAFADDAESIYEPTFTHGRDTFSVPNRVIAIARTDGETEAMRAVAQNEDPDDPLSFYGRGRWIAHIETDVEATSQAVLNDIAQRRLTELMAVTSTLEIKHAPIPLELNDTVTFRRDEVGLVVTAVVQKLSVPLEQGASATATLLEVTT